MAYLCVEFVYIMWVRGRRGAESVSFIDESFCDFSEFGYNVRGVTLGNVVFFGGV